jgi:hypothetical protein
MKHTARNLLMILLSAMLVCIALPCRAQDAPPKAPIAAAKPKTLRTAWYLLSYESRRVGYRNVVLSRLTGDGPATHRLTVHDFLRSSPTDKQPTQMDKTVCEMDAEWTALSFESSRSVMGIDRMTVKGRVIGNKLSVECTAGGERLQWTTDIAGRPTFDQAYLQWVAARELDVGKIFERHTIDALHGLVATTPRVARIAQPTTLRTRLGNKPGFVLIEQSGAQVTGHLLHADGRLFRSEGQNHNWAVQTVSPAERKGLKLDGSVKWHEHIDGRTGPAYGSATFGYTVALPAFPYVMTARGEGRFVGADNAGGSDGVFLLAVSAPPGNDAETRARTLYGRWAKSVGAAEQVTDEPIELQKLPGLLFKGQTRSGGRPSEFSLAVIARGHVGYLIGRVRLLPGASKDDHALHDVLKSLRWTRIFGRERGQWQGDHYVSQSYGYRLKLLAPGWRVPEDRSGVATSIEAVRTDRSAVLTVTFEATADDTSLSDRVKAYRKKIETNVPGAMDLQQEDARLGGQAAVLLRYKARAIDNKPTVSHHVLAIEKGRRVIVTIVTRQDEATENLKHFKAVVASFRFTPVSPATP